MLPEYIHVESPCTDRVADRLQCVHDLRLIRASQIQQPAAGDHGQLGYRLLEYCLQVPANRIGYTVYNAAQLKTIQEIITLVVFVVFSVPWLGAELTWNHLVGFALMVGAAFFVLMD